MKRRIVTNIRTVADAQEYLFEQNEQEVRRLYFDLDMTAKQVCETLGVPYSQRIQKDFYAKLGPKGKGWGGKRRGSGNKKGWNDPPR